MFGNNISLRCISFLLSFHFSIILSSPLSTYYYKHICLSFQLSRNPFIFLSINLTIYLSLYLFIFLSIYLLIYYLSSPPPSNIYFSVCQLTCLKKMYNWKKKLCWSFEMESTELSLCHKLLFSNFYIFATRCQRLMIIQTMNS